MSKTLRTLNLWFDVIQKNLIALAVAPDFCNGLGGPVYIVHGILLRKCVEILHRRGDEVFVTDITPFPTKQLSTTPILS